MWNADSTTHEPNDARSPYDVGAKPVELIEWIFWACAIALGYSLVGYPLTLALVGWRPRRIVNRGAALPRVSLIVPAHDEATVLRTKLENSLALAWPGSSLEILVASDGSSDDTVRIAREFEPRGVRVLDFPQRRGKASVVNDAVAASTGDVLCLCDANVYFRPRALLRLVRRLADPRVGAASGDVRLASHESDFGAGESLYYRLERCIHTGESRIGSMMGVDGGMYVIRRELFRPLPPDTILDDFVISMGVIQQGRKVVYEPRAVADENATASARQEFRRRVRVAAGAAQSLRRGVWPPLALPVEFWQYFSHKLLRWLTPLFLAGLLIGASLLWSQGLVYRIALLAQLGAYGLAGLACLWPSLRRLPLAGVAFFFALSQVGLCWGFAKGLLRRQQGIWARTERTALVPSSNGAPAARAPQ